MDTFLAGNLHYFRADIVSALNHHLGSTSLSASSVPNKTTTFMWKKQQ